MTEPLLVRIGEYHIKRVLGQGGISIVYLAHHTDTGRDVAIKTVKTEVSEDLRRQAELRFVSEAAAGRLEHKNLITVYEAGSWNGGFPYIAMEYVDGEPLDRVISDLKVSGKRLPVLDVLDIVRQVCEGLDFAHRHMVFHLNVKPANVVRRRDDGLIKVWGFGIYPASVLLLGGGVSHMPPEQLTGQSRADRPLDIYAIGIMLYSLLTGHQPFTGPETGSVMMKILNDPYTPLTTHLSAYPPAIDQILDRALAKSPADRYPTAQEFATDLGAVISELKQRGFTITG